jgi:hypothetical protein
MTPLGLTDDLIGEGSTEAVPDAALDSGGTPFRAYARITRPSGGGSATKFVLLDLDPSQLLTGTLPGGTLLAGFVRPVGASSSTLSNDLALLDDSTPDVTITLTPSTALDSVTVVIERIGGRDPTGVDLDVFVALDGDVVPAAPTVPARFVRVGLVDLQLGGGFPARFEISLGIDDAVTMPAAPSTTDVPAEKASVSIELSDSPAPLPAALGVVEGPPGIAPAVKTTAAAGLYRETNFGNIRVADLRVASAAQEVELDLGSGPSPLTTAVGVPISFHVTVPRVRAAPPEGMTAQPGSGSGAVARGDYRYFVTFVLRNGNETDLSRPLLVTVDQDTAVVAVGAIPTGPAEGAEPLDVIGRRLYRTHAGGAGEPFLLTDALADDNTTTSFQDGIADAALGRPAPGRADVQYAGPDDFDLTARILTLDRAISDTERLTAVATLIDAPAVVHVDFDNRRSPRLRYDAAAPLGAFELELLDIEGADLPFVSARVDQIPSALTADWLLESATDSRIELGGAAVDSPADAIASIAAIAATTRPGALPTATVELDLASIDVEEASERRSPKQRAAVIGGLRQLRLASAALGGELSSSLLVVVSAPDPGLHVRAGVESAAGAAPRNDIDIQVAALTERTELTLVQPRGRPGPPATTRAALLPATPGLGRGDYSYLVTYLLRNGNESDLSRPIEVTVDRDSAAIRLSEIPTGPPPEQSPLDVVGRRIYRTRAGGAGEPFLLAEIADTTATSFDDDTPDGALAAPAVAATPQRRLEATYTPRRSHAATIEVRQTDRERAQAEGVAAAETLTASASLAGIPTRLHVDFDNRRSPRLRYDAAAPLGAFELELPAVDAGPVKFVAARARAIPVQLTVDWLIETLTESTQVLSFEVGGAELEQNADPMEELAVLAAPDEATLPPCLQAVSFALVNAKPLDTPPSTLIAGSIRGLQRMVLKLGAQEGPYSEAGNGLVLTLVRDEEAPAGASGPATRPVGSLRLLLESFVEETLADSGEVNRTHNRIMLRAGTIPGETHLNGKFQGDISARLEGGLKLARLLSIASPPDPIALPVVVPDDVDIAGVNGAGGDRADSRLLIAIPDTPEVLDVVVSFTKEGGLKLDIVGEDDAGQRVPVAASFAFRKRGLEEDGPPLAQINGQLHADARIVLDTDTALEAIDEGPELPNGVRVTAEGAGASGRLALAAPGRPLVAARAVPQARLDLSRVPNEQKIGGEEVLLRALTARALGMTAFQLAVGAEDSDNPGLLSALVRLDSGRLNTAFRLDASERKVQDVAGVQDVARTHLRVGALPDELRFFTVPETGDPGLLGIRLGGSVADASLILESHESGRGSGIGERRDRAGPPRGISSTEARFAAIPVRVDVRTRSGFSQSEASRRANVSSLRDAFGFDEDLSGYDVFAADIKVFGDVELSALERIGYSQDVGPLPGGDRRFHPAWSRTSSGGVALRLADGEVNGIVQLWAPSLREPPNEDGMRAGLGLVVSDELSLSATLLVGSEVFWPDVPDIPNLLDLKAWEWKLGATITFAGFAGELFVIQRDWNHLPPFYFLNDGAPDSGWQIEAHDALPGLGTDVPLPPL